MKYNPIQHSTSELPSVLLDDHSWLTIVLCGFSGVGKTSLVTKFFYGCTPETLLPTITVEDTTKRINIGEKSVRVQVLEMNGQKSFRPITIPYFKRAHGVILIYDVTEEISFNEVSKWVEHIEVNAPKNVECSIVDLAASKIIR